MDYKIIIGFSKPKSKTAIFGNGIRAVLGTDFSHVYVKFKSDKFNRVLIYQASGFAVNFMEESRMLKDHAVVAEFELTVSEATYVKTMQFAIDNAGVPYGIAQIFGILYVKALALASIRAKNPFANGDSNFVCSELVGEILKEIVGLEVDYDMDLITPKEIFELLKKYQIPEMARE